MVKTPKRPPRPGKRPARPRARPAVAPSVAEKPAPPVVETVPAPPVPAPPAPPKIPTPVYAAAPDETGMLQIRSMDDDDGDAAAANSATQFFLRPPPKKTPPPIAAVSPTAPVAQMGAITGATSGGAPPPAAGGFGGITGPTTGAGPGPGAGISGGSLSDSPTLDAPPDASGQRNLVLVGLLVAFLLFAVTSVGGLVYWKSLQEADGGEERSQEMVASSTRSEPEPVEETALPEDVVKDPEPVRRSSRRSSRSSSSRTTTAAPVAKKPPPSKSGKLVLTISGVTHSSAELRCETAPRDKVRFVGDSATFANVDASGCSLSLIGGAGIRIPKNLITGGARINCSYTNGGKGVSCK